MNKPRALAAAGARITDVELDAEFAQLNDIQIRASSYEFFRALTHERLRHSELISASLSSRIAAGGEVTRVQYEADIAAAGRCRARIADVFRNYDVLITPSTPGEAPGIETTGEPIFGLLWTLLRLPCLTLPHGRGPAGLPLGVQVVASHGCDAALFVHAEWMRRALAG